MLEALASDVRNQKSVRPGFMRLVLRNYEHGSRPGTLEEGPIEGRDPEPPKPLT